MKKLATILILMISFYSLTQAQIYYPEGINMPGAWDEVGSTWNQPPTVADLKSKPQSSGNIDTINIGTLRWHTTFSVASSGADIVGGTYEFLFTSGPSSGYYNNKWGGTTVSLNSIQSYTLGSGTNNSITVTNGKYYTVNFQDNGYANTNAIFMETSGAPITITNVSDNYSGAGNAVTVSITTSSTPPTEQLIYVRYTTDNWSTSSFVQASGSGTSYSATIPSAGVTGTSSNFYYVFTTTVSSPSNADADMETINSYNNNGENIALPVELTTFTAALNNNSVDLKWNTATEVNNYGFEIQRAEVNSNSPSGNSHSSFAKIGFVRGAGNSNSPKEYSYLDNSISSGKYSYRLKQIDNNGSFKYSNAVEVNNAVNMPDGYILSQNYPNPFNPSTVIKFGFEKNTHASLSIYDVLGNKVADLFNGQAEAGKTYELPFNAAGLSSGIYFYQLQGNNITRVKKMLLLK